MSEHDERCARCGEVGEDRRTLWMACFYAMNELPIPFEETKLLVVDEASVTRTTQPEPWTSKTYHGDGRPPTESSGISQREVLTASGPAAKRGFFTLRVCKECRGDWMAAIQSWYETPPRDDRETGTGAWMRENGALREMTEEEIAARGGNVVRVKAGHLKEPQ